MREGLIIKINSTMYTVKSEQETFNCVLRGKFRNQKITPVVGDRVLFDETELIINEIKERKNILSRPPVSNIDIGLIVTSAKLPDLNTTLLDKLISIVIMNNIKPVLCFTKLDLLQKDEKKELKKLIKYYKKIGIPSFTNKEIKKLKKSLTNSIVVVCGQTGAGKSTLINKFDNKLNLNVGEVSMALGRGKHTTRIVELFSLKNFYIVDTPGFSKIDIEDYDTDQIKNSFVEFNNCNCKFKDCRHTSNLGCKVIEKVKNGEILQSRYDNYLRFIGVNK